MWSSARRKWASLVATTGRPVSPASRKTFSFTASCPGVSCPWTSRKYRSPKTLACHSAASRAASQSSSANRRATSPAMHAEVQMSPAEWRSITSRSMRGL